MKYTLPTNNKSNIDMENFNEKLNLMKFKKSGVMQIQGKGEVLKCLIIPIEENHLFVSTDESGKPKAVYFDLIAWGLQNSKYGDTHMLKQSLPKDVREKMSDEERKSQPIFGSMKPVNNADTEYNAPFAQALEEDELPF